MEVEKEICREEEEILPWLTESEFVHKYRVSRKNFQRILLLIEDHPVFYPTEKRGNKQAPVMHQLMVFLRFVGTGDSQSDQRLVFHIGYGTTGLYRDRVTKALRSLKDRFITWPDAQERFELGYEANVRYSIPHCVAIADGTLFPLANEPETEDAPDYSGRKFGYSISTMIICDLNRKIRHYLAGYPGSVHDNRIFKDTVLATNPSLHFDPQQFILGDSAFENQWFVVSAFKKLPEKRLDEYEELFNAKMSPMRVISEHCIGILKGRFPWLRRIPIKVTDNVKSLKTILCVIEATIILHNMLIEFDEEDRKEWLDEDSDETSQMDDWKRVPYEEDDVLNLGIPQWATKHERRNRLLDYLKEYVFLRDKR
jgi:hypothetical protein